LKEADNLQEILPSVRLLLAECVKYIINRVSYYYPPRLPREVLAEREDVKTGEVDPNLWIALEDLRDGWDRSGQVGQEVYGAGIAFGVVPRQYYKVKEAGFMVFTEYPATQFTTKKQELTFFTRGDERLSFRIALLPIDGKAIPQVRVWQGMEKDMQELRAEKGSKKEYVEYKITGNRNIKITWG